MYKNLTIKPTYVVKYHEENDTYSVIMSSDEFVKLLLSAGKCAQTMENIDGWAASKSHTADPSRYTIAINLFKPIKNEDGDIEFNGVCVWRKMLISNCLYLKHHDLFLYPNKSDAIVAGGEMKIIDKVSNIDINGFVNVFKNLANRVVDKIDTEAIAATATAFGDVVKDKIYAQLKKKGEKFSDEAMARIKDAVDEFMNSINDYEAPEKDDKPSTADHKHTCVCNNEKTASESCITVSFPKRKTVSIGEKTENNKTEYWLIATDLDDLSNIIDVNITKEQYDIINALMLKNDRAGDTYNDIINVLSMCHCGSTHAKQVDIVDHECKCSKKAKEKIKSQKRGSQKFYEGDSVIDKNGNIGKVIQVDSTFSYYWGHARTRKMYSVKLKNGMIRSYYSYELNHYDLLHS